MGLFKRSVPHEETPAEAVERFLDGVREGDEASIAYAALVNLQNAPFLPVPVYSAREHAELNEWLARLRAAKPVRVAPLDPWYATLDKGYRGITITNPGEPAERSLHYSREVSRDRESAERIIVFNGAIRDSKCSFGEGYPDPDRNFEKWLIKLIVLHGGRAALKELQGLTLPLPR